MLINAKLDDDLNANRSKPMQLIEPHKPLTIFVEFDMVSLLQFPPHLRMKFRLLVFKGVRLVINQSVWI